MILFSDNNGVRYSLRSRLASSNRPLHVDTVYHMATNKNRNTIRVRNVSLRTTVECLQNTISLHFAPEENAAIKFKLITLAPTCTDQGETQMAIIKFSPSMPGFLSGLGQKRIQIEVDNREYIDIDQDFFGLTQLYPTIGSTIPLDIVAVTGLNDHAFGSWTGGEYERMWLQDFLRNERYLQACRTMIFGYNVKLKDKTAHKTSDVVQSFLEELKKARQSPEERSRPIVFLGHSFGGILIAHALVKANNLSHLPGKEDYDYGSLVKSTHALLFFGVPYRGITIEDVSRMVEEDSETQRASLAQEIIEFSKSITPCMESFINLTMDKRIVSFYETRSTKAVTKDENGKYGRFEMYIRVVEESSAMFYLLAQIGKAIPVDADHSTIVKFTSFADDTYQTVRNLLRSYVKSVENKMAAGSLLPDPNFGDRNSRSPITRPSHSVISTGRLLNCQFDGDINGPGEAALFGAAMCGNREVVEFLLQSGSNPNLLAANGKTPLHEASRCGHVAVVQLLLDNGADPNARDPTWSSTPLHDAARAGTAAVTFLQRYHADLNAQLKYNLDTPLHLAVRNGHESVVWFLLEKKANPVATNSRGRRPIHDAARAGHVGLVCRLLEWDPKGETSPRDDSGATPLHEAARGGYDAVVWLLLKRGADRDATLRNGKRATDLAEEGGHFGVKRLILEMSMQPEPEILMFAE